MVLTSCIINCTYFKCSDVFWQMYKPTNACIHAQLFQSCLTLRHPMDRGACCQAPLSMGFPRQEYWSGLPFPPPGDLRDPGIKPVSPVSACTAGRFFATEPAVHSWKHHGSLNRAFPSSQNVFYAPLCTLTITLDPGNHWIAFHH